MSDGVYVNGNVVNLVDPMGLAYSLVPMAVGAGGGFIGGGLVGTAIEGLNALKGRGFSWGRVWRTATTGAIGGAAGGAVLGAAGGDPTAGLILAAGATGGAVSGGLESSLTSLETKGHVDVADVAQGTVIGGTIGIVTAGVPIAGGTISKAAAREADELSVGIAAITREAVPEGSLAPIGPGVVPSGTSAGTRAIFGEGAEVGAAGASSSTSGSLHAMSSSKSTGSSVPSGSKPKVIIGRHSERPVVTGSGYESHHGVWKKWVKVYARKLGITTDPKTLDDMAPTLFVPKGATSKPGPSTYHNATRSYLNRAYKESGYKMGDPKFWSEMSEEQARMHGSKMMDLFNLTAEQKEIYWHYWDEYFKAVMKGQL